MTYLDKLDPLRRRLELSPRDFDVLLRQGLRGPVLLLLLLRLPPRPLLGRSVITTTTAAAAFSIFGDAAVASVAEAAIAGLGSGGR